MPGSLAAPPRRRSGSRLYSTPVLLFAFAFAVMADPVSSVAYAIEAPLRAMHGDLALLLPAMALVIAVDGVVIVNYHQLVARFPEGGGAAAAAGAAFGEALAFVPIGALIVDFVLTIAISDSAAASAVIAYVPALAPWRIPLALGVLLAVAGLTWFGHLGRAVFAAMTVGFVVVCTAVILGAIGTHVPVHGAPLHVNPGHPALIALLLAFPVAMALATGTEAPSSAIAQLGQLDNDGRRRFGRITLWLTLGIVGALTLGLTAEAVRLHVGVPRADSTQISDLAKLSVGGGLYALFQAFTALLLLAAASSSFQAGPGLLKALARRTHHDGDEVGVLPRWLGATNDHHTPYWAVIVFLAVSAVATLLAGGDDQTLVLYYAVSVFISFLVGLLAMATFQRREHRLRAMLISVLGAAVVAFTLLVNLARGNPILSVAASLAIAYGLYRQWIRAGRPRGIAQVVAHSEEYSS